MTATTGYRPRAVHLAAPLADALSRAGRGRDDTQWTACGLWQRRELPPAYTITGDVALVTCGNCKRAARADASA